MPGAGWSRSGFGSLLFPWELEYRQHGIHAAHGAEQLILKSSVAEGQSSAFKQEMLADL